MTSAGTVLDLIDSAVADEESVTPSGEMVGLSPVFSRIAEELKAVSDGE